MMHRRLSLSPSTFDRTAGTVRATLSTGAAVQRAGYVEKLDIAPGAVEISGHVPVLDSHRQGSIADVMGRVGDVKFGPEGITATLRISSPAALDAIERGDLTGVSIGYRVGTWSDTRADGVMTRTATKWRLMEVSLVPLPADSGDILRSENPMSETTETPDVEATADRAAINQSIRSIANLSGLDAAWANMQIDNAATVTEARAAAFAAMVQRGGGTIRTASVEAGFSNDDPAVQLTRMTEALTARIMPAMKPSDAARPYMNLGLVDMARSVLQARGERVGMVSREDVITRAMHTTSDSPNLLTATGNRVLASAYEAAPNPLKMLARQATLNDFRAKSTLRISDMPKLAKVNEAGEIKSVSRTESRETYALETYGQIFRLSRKAIIKDDLGAFADYALAMGRAAAETEADQLVQLLAQASGAGPLMSDGKRLFAPEHGNNAGTGAPPTVAALSGARQAMRDQKGLDGRTPINATPKYLLIGSALETVVDQLLAAIYAQTPADVNPFTARLIPMVEPRLPATSWYVFADPAVMPVLEYAHLSSAQGPQIASRQGWVTLGVEFRCVLDFGCGAIDWRGAYRNAGA